MDNKKRALFGPAGASDAAHDGGVKSTFDNIRWVKNFGLDAFEYQAGNGLHASYAALKTIGLEAARLDVAMSFHTPYFISLSGIEQEKRLKSITYIADSLKAAEALGADTIVVHTGSAAKISREEALGLAADTLRRTLEQVDTRGIRIGLETMGKKNQLGTLEEVLSLCKIDPVFCPVVDFGHLNARDCGGVFPDAAAYRTVFDKISDALGASYAETLHCHFSHIEYTSAGEKRHVTFEGDVQGWGPDFGPLAEVIAKDGLCPRIICESAGTQDADALTMKNQYLARLAELG